uniref:Glutamate-rich 3 n=1 Tax=Tetraodon nigroviridis TaxID=99883 RepID=H3C5B2_TETNG
PLSVFTLGRPLLWSLQTSDTSTELGSSRPNTAPGEMQRPVRLKPIHSKHPRASLGRSSPSRPPNPPKENHQPLGCTMESRRRLTGLEASGGISPYCLPVINTFVTPVPPPPKRKELGPKVTPSSAHRGRRLRVSTLAPAYEVRNHDIYGFFKSAKNSRVSVNMIYFGKKVHLAHDLHDTRDEVKVYQQHCGGENLCVYKGLLHKGERFQFVSRRHRGFPFSLTFFLNGLQVERLSSCCEFKHRRASRLGGRHRHFGFCSVEGASPCYKCIIAIGLDKQPNPPPKRSSDQEESEAETDIDRPKESDPEEKCVRQEERTHPDPEGTSEVEPKDSEESQYSSEPELSDTSTEDEEEEEDEQKRQNQEETEAKDVEQNDEARDEVEEKPEDKDKEKQTDPNEMGDGDNRGNEDEKNDTADGKTDRSQKTNEGEDSKSVKDESEEEEKEAIDVDEKTSKMCEKDRKNETDESRAEQTEAGEKNSGNCEKEEEGGTVNSDELGKNTDADSAKDMKKPEENVVETEDETVRTESVTHKDAKEAETEAQTDVETGKHTGNEIKTDEVTEEERAEATDLTAEPGDGPEKHRCEQEKQVEGTQGDQSAVPLSSGKMVDNPGLEETKEEAGDVER